MRIPVVAEFRKLLVRRRLKVFSVLKTAVKRCVRKFHTDRQSGSYIAKSCTVLFGSFAQGQKTWFMGERLQGRSDGLSRSAKVVGMRPKCSELKEKSDLPPEQHVQERKIPPAEGLVWDMFSCAAQSRIPAPFRGTPCETPPAWVWGFLQAHSLSPAVTQPAAVVCRKVRTQPSLLAESVT